MAMRHRVEVEVQREPICNPALGGGGCLLCGTAIKYTTKFSGKYLRHTCVYRPLDQCFSTFVRPRPGKFFFKRRGPCPNAFTRKYLSSFFKVDTL